MNLTKYSIKRIKNASYKSSDLCYGYNHLNRLLDGCISWRSININQRCGFKLQIDFKVYKEKFNRTCICYLAYLDTNIEFKVNTSRPYNIINDIMEILKLQK